MIPFTPGELALDRAPFAADLPDACRVQRWAQVADGAGGYTETWTPEAGTVPCRVAPRGMTATEQPVAGRTGLVQLYTITLAQGTTVAAEDRISWETGDALLQVVDPGGRSRELSRRVQAVRVT